MALPPDDHHLFIPLPAPEHSNTPILKWVLSRPNTHLYPLHLLTTGRSLDVATEEIVGDQEKSSSDGDVPSGFESDFDAFSRDADAKPDDVSDERGFEQFPATMGGTEGGAGLSPNCVQSTSLADVFLQNPHDATSTTMGGMGGVPPLSPFSLPPISTLFASLPPLPPALQRPDDMLQLLGLSQILQQQALTMMQHLQQSQQPVDLLQRLRQLQTEHLQSGSLLLKPLQQARQEVAYDLLDEGEFGREPERDWRDYTPVLPPSPVYDPLPTADSEVKEEDDVIKSEDDGVEKKGQREIIASCLQKTRSPVAARAHVHRPAAAAAVAAATAAVRSSHCRKQPAANHSRLALTPQQRNVFRGIVGRLSFLCWPEERETLATAFGLNQRQVINVLISSGGRASRRRALGTSEEEAQIIIREELHKFGFALKDEDEEKKKNE